MPVDRRKFLGMGAIFGAATVACGKDTLQVMAPTPTEIEGPFYPVVAQPDKDFDLTVVGGRKKKAQGEIVHISGKVLSTGGNPVDGAIVDIWQANSFGKYRHPYDPSQSPLDKNFQGWAIIPSGAKGQFKFKTVVPGSYPVSADWTRPPHIHFKVSKRGYIELITQMYFPGVKLNEKDRLLQSKSTEEQVMMIASHTGNTENNERILSYNIVLESV